jgi:uncharacterized protein (DUF1330 family)
MLSPRPHSRGFLSLLGCAALRACRISDPRSPPIIDPNQRERPRKSAIFWLREEDDVALRYLIGFSVLFGLCSFLPAKLYAPEGSPPAYYVTIFDSGSIIADTNYPSLFPSTFRPFGGRYIMHFGTEESFDGRPPERVVVIKFNSMHDLLAWHSSDAFKDLYDAHRVGRLRAFAVEGVNERIEPSSGY